MNLPLRAALASAAASPFAAVRSAAAVAAAAAAGSVAYVRSWHPSTAEVQPVVAVQPQTRRDKRRAKKEKEKAQQKKDEAERREQERAAAEAEDGKAASEAPPIKLPRVAIEAICGAAGEIAQVGVLYPLETLKVRCQSEGLSVRGVLAAMVAAASKDGAGGASAALRSRRVLAALYSGFGSAAALSVVVGAVHYASFCASKRMALAEGGGGAAAEAAADKAKKTKKQQQQQQKAADDGNSNGHGGGGNAGANLTAASVGALVTALVESPAELFRHRAQAGTLEGAGGGGSVWRAMSEAVRLGGPGALFYGFGAYLMESVPYDVAELGVYGSLRDWIDGRRAALGVGGEGGGGKKALSATAAISSSGPALLLSADGDDDAREGGFPVPGRGTRRRRQTKQQQQEEAAAAAAAAASSSSSPAALLQRRLGDWADSVVASAPAEALDLAAGAAAGTAAVFISMPLDVIKTYIQTHPEEAAKAAERALASLPPLIQRNGVARFAAVGAELARRGGAGALLAGLAPRLAQQVPSAMLCWLVLERCRAGLEPFMAA